MNLQLISIILITLILSIVLTHFFKLLFYRLGYIGIDQFKLDHPKIPTCVGISYAISSIISVFLLEIFGFLNLNITIAYILSMTLSAILGILDDKFDPPGYYKPIVMIIPGIPVIVYNCYTPYLKTILFGGFNLPLIYPLMILVAFSVTSNTVNMLDVINGSATIGVFFVLLAGLISSIILKSQIGVILCIVLLAALIGLLIYNVYPAKIFLGNVGTLSIGASIAFIAIVSSIELPLIIAMFPFIHNSFYFLAKVKMFIEHKKLSVHVTTLTSDGKIIDACDENAPLTLLRLLVSTEPKKENEALLDIIILFAVSFVLSIVTALLIVIRV